MPHTRHRLLLKTPPTWFNLFLYAMVAMVSTGCLCSSTPTDEERLKKKIDTSVVHLYVASKVAVTKADASPEVKAAREKLIQFVNAVKAAQSKNKADAGDTQGGAKPETDDAATISASDWLAIGKSLWGLKKEGERIVQNDSEDEYAPVLPIFLKHSGASDKLIALIDIKTEHALLYLVMSMLNAHPKSPVAVPGEILLYEAWKTSPESIAFPSIAGPFHALKAWTFANNDLCDLSLTEAQAAETWRLEATAFGEDFQKIVQSKGALDTKDAKQLNAAVHASGFGSVAYCHIARGDDREARPHLRKFIDYGSQTGALRNEDIAALDIFYQCGGEDDEIATGQKSLADAKQRGVMPKEEIDLLTAYCDAADKSSIDAIRKALFVTRVLQIAYRSAQDAGVYESVQESDLYQTVSGFAGVTQNLSATDKTQVGAKLEDMKKSAADWLKKQE